MSSGPLILKIEEQLNCFGHFGFGSGWSLAAHGRTPSGNAYCSDCAQKKACWEAHKLRVKQFFPEATTEFEEMAKTMRGPALVKAWKDKYHCLDPYLAVFCGNVEDGNAVAAGLDPKDRGRLTLIFPFPKEAA